MTEQWVWQIVISLLLFAAAYCLVRYAWRTAQAVILRTEQRLDVALNKQLLLDVNPRLVLGLFALMIVVVGLLASDSMSSSLTASPPSPRACAPV